MITLTPIQTWLFIAFLTIAVLAATFGAALSDLWYRWECSCPRCGWVYSRPFAWWVAFTVSRHEGRCQYARPDGIDRHSPPSMPGRG